MSEAKAAIAEAEQPKPLTLGQKILKIQNEVGVVKKKGKFGSEMGGSNYLRIEDAVVAVNKLMCREGLILTGSMVSYQRDRHETESTNAKGEITSNKKGYIVHVDMRWQIEDTATGENREYLFSGDGYDSTDKAVYKAQTGSRKYAIINIFNLPIGNDVEEHGFVPEEAKGKQKQVAQSKIADAAGRGNKTAIDSYSQIEPEKTIRITRPEEHNGNYICVFGYIATPPLDQFFNDTDSKRFKTKDGNVPYWRVAADYEKGLIELCDRLKIAIE